MLMLSSCCAGLPLTRSLTFFKCVFIAMSTPAEGGAASGETCLGSRMTYAVAICLPVIVPTATVPFFSSICTVSFANFIRNLRHNRGGQ